MRVPITLKLVVLISCGFKGRDCSSVEAGVVRAWDGAAVVVVVVAGVGVVVVVPHCVSEPLIPLIQHIPSIPLTPPTLLGELNLLGVQLNIYASFGEWGDIGELECELDCELVWE